MWLALAAICLLRRTVADLDAHIVIAELSQHLRSGFGEWRGSHRVVSAGVRCSFESGHKQDDTHSHFVPVAAQCTAKKCIGSAHSITSSARARSIGGTSRPSGLTVLRFPSDYRPPSMSRCRKSSLQQSDGHLSCENLLAAFQVRSLRDPYPQALPCRRSHSQIYCALQDYISVRLVHHFVK
jgi:hypothetical protein